MRWRDEVWMKSQIKLPITKFDAAKRQLETAIRLWFFSGDPVSIHTLAAAAHQVLHDLNQKHSGHPSVRDVGAYVKPESRDKFHKLLNEAENFFKHAKRDPEATLFFKPDVTPFLLMEAIMIYERFTGESAPVFKTFSCWMFFNFPDVIDENHRNKFPEIETLSEEVKQRLSKAEFFGIVLPIAIRQLGI